MIPTLAPRVCPVGMNPESSIDYVKGESAVPPIAACLTTAIRDRLMDDYPDEGSEGEKVRVSWTRFRMGGISRHFFLAMSLYPSRLLGHIVMLAALMNHRISVQQTSSDSG